jgi:hypothetical protein
MQVKTISKIIFECHFNYIFCEFCFSFITTLTEIEFISSNFNLSFEHSTVSPFVYSQLETVKFLEGTLCDDCLQSQVNISFLEPLYQIFQISL